jgi:hypothetical protein
MPWNPSMTCGPEAPRPRMNRPPETLSSPTAVIASNVGVREYSGRMLEPIRTRSVLAAMNPSVDTASPEYASPVHTQSTPAASSRPRCRAKLAGSPRCATVTLNCIDDLPLR